MDEEGPSTIVPTPAKKFSAGGVIRTLRHTFFTRQGLLGDYNYAYLFTPSLPFMKKQVQNSPFFGLNDRMPVVLALILGFQHSLSMLAGIITPPLILAGAAGVNMGDGQQQYLVSTALIVSGLLSMIQITRFHIYKTRYYVGTGLISVVGISFSIIPVAEGAFAQMYAQVSAPWLKMVLCYLVLTLLRIFPPIVTGPTVMLIGIHLIETAFQNWAGGSGLCADADPIPYYKMCPNIDAPHPLPWGSAEFLGLGFSVFITIILCERFGAPIMKSTSIVCGLLVGCIIAGACGYFDRSTIDAAPAVSFAWVETFKLKVYGPLVLPLLAVYIICACEAIGDITASCDVSRLEIEGPVYESRLQGGVLADGLNGIFAALMTITPMSTFAQNNGVIALTKCANRKAGYCCCMFLLIMGIFSKFAAALVAIPSAVIGGMTTFLFCSVAVSGMAIINRGMPFNRRNRFILTAGLALGFGATLVPTYFEHFFTYKGNNHSLQGFLNAINLIMETGFTVTAAVCMALNAALPEEVEEDFEETPSPQSIEAEEQVMPSKGLTADSSRMSGSQEDAEKAVRQ